MKKQQAFPISAGPGISGIALGQCEQQLSQPSIGSTEIIPWVSRRCRSYDPLLWRRWAWIRIGSSALIQALIGIREQR
jgi:hypothetical protein